MKGTNSKDRRRKRADKKEDAGKKTAGERYEFLAKPSKILLILIFFVSILFIVVMMSKRILKGTEEEGAMERIVRLNGGRMPEYETKKDGTFLWLLGCFSEKQVYSLSDALDALQEIHSLLGIQDAKAELRETSVTKDKTGVICHFEQVYENIPVYGSMVSVWADENGETGFLRADCTWIPENFDCTPAISMSEAQSAFLSRYPDSSIDRMAYEIQGMEDEKYLCIYDAGDGGIPRLAWRVYVIMKGEECEAVIDTSKGTLLHIRTTGFSAREQSLETVASDLLEKRRLFTVTKNTNGIYELRDKGRKIIVYDAGGSLSDLPGNIITAKNMNRWDKTSVSAMANLRSVYDYYRDCLGRYSYNGGLFSAVADPVRISVNTGIADNAYWSGSKSMILIGEGSSSGMFLSRSLAAGEDIIAHEFTHAVISEETALEYTYYGAAGAINEGYADIFGCLVEGDWKIGEDVVKEKCLRDIAIPFNTGNPSSVGGACYIDYKTDSTDYGGVHRNSTIISHIAYALQQKGITKRNLYQLWYKSLCLGYGKYADFYDVRMNVLTAAAALHFSSGQIAVIQEVFDDANIRKENCQDTDASYFRWLTAMTEDRENKSFSSQPGTEIILRWQETELDLDLSVTGKTEDGTLFTIHYETPEYREENGMLAACLVADKTRGPAEEIIRIWDSSIQITNCEVSVYGEYEKDGFQWKDSVTVSVYENGRIKRTCVMPENTGTVWHVILGN